MINLRDPKTVIGDTCYAPSFCRSFRLAASVIRFSSLGLLGTTFTIGTFVYSDAWPTHLS